MQPNIVQNMTKSWKAYLSIFALIVSITLYSIRIKTKSCRTLISVILSFDLIHQQHGADDHPNPKHVEFELGSSRLWDSFLLCYSRWTDWNFSSTRWPGKTWTSKVPTHQKFFWQSRDVVGVARLGKIKFSRNPSWLYDVSLTLLLSNGIN